MRVMRGISGRVDRRCEMQVASLGQCEPGECRAETPGRGPAGKGPTGKGVHGKGASSKSASGKRALPAALKVVGLLLVAASVVLAAYPFLSSRWGAYRANRQFTSERAIAAQYDQQEVDREIAEAEAYNVMLAGNAAQETVVPYESQLDCEGSRVICWLDIPSIDVKIPVFRDDGADDVPLEGAEHVRGTSLPVGGVPSNTVITAHSGAHAGTSMAFNKLDFLEEGDAVVLWTYGRPYAYAVSGMEQTSPDDTSALMVAEGTDQLTLLTCRPIGTTARRLLVHAQRAEYVPGGEGVVRMEVLADPDLALFVAALLVGGLALWSLLLLSPRMVPRCGSRAFSAGSETGGLGGD